MKDKLDQQLTTIFRAHRNNDLPNKTKIVIENTFLNLEKNMYKNKKRIVHKITACFAIFIVGCSIVFAKELKNLAQNIFKYDVQGAQGVQVAVDKGYIQNVNMEYIEVDDTKFKIDYVTMDDTNLALNFNFLLNENASDFKGISFYNMKIYDDSENIIYIEEEKYPNEGISLGIGIAKPVYINENNIIQSFLIESDRFPKTKNLRITFDKITLYNENYGNPITKEINGNFDIMIEIDEKFYNRKTRMYNIELTEGNKEVGLEKVFLTDTSFNLIVNNPKLNRISAELKNEKGEIIYSQQDILLMEINDNSGKKIAKLDTTKYNIGNYNIELTIIGDFINEKTNDIYLYNYQTEEDGSYDISKITQNTQKDENNVNSITAKYILREITDN